MAAPLHVLAEYFVYSIPLVFATIGVHELLHFSVARFLGYRVRRFFYSLKLFYFGVEVEDTDMTVRDAVLVALAPQALTLAYLAASRVTAQATPILAYVLYLMAIANTIASFKDFYEIYAFTRKQRVRKQNTYIYKIPRPTT